MHNAGTLGDVFMGEVKIPLSSVTHSHCGWWVYCNIIIIIVCQIDVYICINIFLVAKIRVYYKLIPNNIFWCVFFVCLIMIFIHLYLFA